MKTSFFTWAALLGAVVVSACSSDSATPAFAPIAVDAKPAASNAAVPEKKTAPAPKVEKKAAPKPAAPTKETTKQVDTVISTQTIVS